MQRFAQGIVNAAWFEPLMIGLILFNGVLIGLETSDEILREHGELLHLGNHVILGVFMSEGVLKIGGVAPRYGRYFGNGWNLFDFSIVILSLVPATEEFGLVARLVRILRVLRLVSAVPQLRLIVATLVRSIPSMGHVILLMSIIFYIYAVTGLHLFRAADPEHWGTLGAALLTLFQVVTLEGWVDLMETASRAHASAWVYFVSLVVIGTLVVVNLCIAGVVNNLESSKAAELDDLQQPPGHDELIAELRRTKAALDDLERRLETAARRGS